MTKIGQGILAALLLAGGVARAEEGAAGVDVRWIAAMKANDVAAVVACYGPDAVVWLPGAPEARGIEAIRGTYAGLLGENTVVDVGTSNEQYATSGDLSCGWGNFTLTLKPKKGGDVQVLNGRYVVVAKKIGGKWLYVADHASLEPPPTAPSAKP